MLIAATLVALPPRSAYTVDIAQPVIRWIAIDQKVRLCATDAVIDGCTAFARETLVCDCEETGGAWQISAVAHSAPTVYLLDGKRATVDHELRHIEDIRSELEMLLASLTSRQFGSQNDCLHASERAKEGFRQQMNALRAQSQARYR